MQVETGRFRTEFLDNPELVIADRELAGDMRSAVGQKMAGFPTSQKIGRLSSNRAVPTDVQYDEAWARGAERPGPGQCWMKPGSVYTIRYTTVDNKSPSAGLLVFVCQDLRLESPPKRQVPEMTRLIVCCRKGQRPKRFRGRA